MKKWAVMVAVVCSVLAGIALWDKLDYDRDANEDVGLTNGEGQLVSKTTH